MQKSTWSLAAVLAAAILLIAGATTSAQSPNLLTNPGFEPPFANAGGTPARLVAQGWTPWHIGGGQTTSENVQPEYYAASDVTNGLGIPRIRSGADAQQYHSFFATHDGGLYQRVAGVTNGASLRFSAYVYVWSSTFDDVNLSEQPGGVVVQVGIDPTGGTDGQSSTIVWSTPAVQYDAYSLYTVDATARASAVTVFIRTTVSLPVKSTNIYVDDAELVVSGAGPQPSATATATATRTPTPSATPLPPTNTPSDLGIVPTETLPPSPTPLPPSATLTATLTQLPPTATPIPTVIQPPTATVAPMSPTPTQDVLLPTQPPVTPSPTSITIGGTPIGAVFPGTITHVVRSGDTVARLASLYGSSIEAIIAVNGLRQDGFIQVGQALVVPVRLPPPATSTPTATPVGVVNPPQPPTGAVYIVRSGDTLLRIATRFGTTVSAIARANNITNPNRIQAGQRLFIPGPGNVVNPPTPQPPVTPQTTYVVRPGDTLFRIAVRFNLPVFRLAQANGITNTNLIYVGQVLIIP